jgi:Ca2+-binding EF-hand superfamily protein
MALRQSGWLQPDASESSEGDDDNDDVFDESGISMPAAPRSGAPVSLPVGGRRGSVVQLGGGRSAALSFEAELAAALKRLRKADDSGDVNEMHAALQAVGGRSPAIAGRVISMVNGEEAQEIARLAMKLAKRMADDDDMRSVADLRRSRLVREHLRRLWDLMVVESQCLAGDPSGSGGDGGASRSVTRDGYRQLHVRIGKVLADASLWGGEARALIRADKDWAEDISRFSGTSHIMVWLDDIRSKFRAAAARSVQSQGFAALFSKVDADGSGEIDGDEFMAAVRHELAIGLAVMPDDEVRQVFEAVDTDGSGEVDAAEFMAWLEGKDIGPPVKRGRRRALEKVKQRFKLASREAVEGLGWQRIFEMYDDDESGELELEEFSRAVRQECSLAVDAVSDREVAELFHVIDADGSGAIDSTELQSLLCEQIESTSMTFGAFYSAIFELIQGWVLTESEEQ